MFRMMMKSSAIFAMAIGASTIAPVGPVAPTAAHAFSFGKDDCGGEGQKTCISFNKDKRCDAGLRERRQSGRNICVKPDEDGANLRDCGGLGEKSCVHVLSSKRCEAGLVELHQKGRNVCVEETMGVDTTKGCGGIGENSCWSLRASDWCDPGLIYKPSIVPGKGTCREADEDNMIEYTRAIASRFNALGSDNELSRLRDCLTSPSRLKELKAAMKEQDGNGTNAIIRECNVDVEKLQEIAVYMFNRSQGTATRAAARNAGVRASSFTTDDDEDDWDDNLAKKFRLTIELSAAAAWGSNSVGGTIGWAIPLHKKPLRSRWYKGSDEYVEGLDASAGADLLIGLGFPGVPGGNDATESGEAGVIAGAVAGKIGMMTRITDEGDPMWAIFGGLGLGVTYATFDYENEFYEDK